MLDDNDLVSAFLFHDPVVYLAYIGLPAVLWFVLFRTRHGMNMKAVGENPAAADAVGVSVTGWRIFYSVLGAALTGAGGAYMVLSFTPTWSPDIARGRGWVALAVVIFAGWRPGWAVAGALLYGSMISLDTTAPGPGLGPAVHGGQRPQLLPVDAAVRGHAGGHPDPGGGGEAW